MPNILEPRVSRPLARLAACALFLSGCSYDWRGSAREAQIDVDAGIDAAAPDNGEADASRDADSSGLLDASDTLVLDGPSDVPVACGAGTCGATGTCSIVTGAISCACAPEWSGARCENDVNECAGDHGCNSRYPCRNTPGGYVCLGAAPAWRLPPLRSGSGGDAASQGLELDIASGTIIRD